MTKTEHEISLVTESNDLEKINEFAIKYNLQNSVQLWPQNWIALRPDLGSAAASGPISPIPIHLLNPK